MPHKGKMAYKKSTKPGHKRKSATKRKTTKNTKRRKY